MEGKASQTFDAFYLYTVVKYFKVPRDASDPKAEEIKFDENGTLALRGDTYAPEREILIKNANPYAVQWQLAWFEIDPKQDDDEPPSQDELLSKASYVITHHHVAVTKQAEVTPETEAGKIAMNIIADYPNVDELEFDFQDDRVKISFDNHASGPLVCSLEEVARSTKNEPYAVHLGRGKLLREDESWTACQQQIRSLKKKVEELQLHIELMMGEREKRRKV